MYQYQKIAAGIVCLAVVLFSAFLSHQEVVAQIESLSAMGSLEYKKTIVLKGDFKPAMSGVSIERNNVGNLLVISDNIYLFDPFGSIIRKLSPLDCGSSIDEWYPITAKFVNRDQIFVAGSRQSFYFDSSGVCLEKADESYRPVQSFCVFPDSDDMYGMDTDLTIIKTNRSGKKIGSSETVQSRFPEIEGFVRGGGIICDQEANRVELVQSIIPYVHVHDRELNFLHSVSTSYSGQVEPEVDLPFSDGSTVGSHASGDSPKMPNLQRISKTYSASDLGDGRILMAHYVSSEDEKKSTWVLQVINEEGEPDLESEAETIPVGNDGLDLFFYAPADYSTDIIRKLSTIEIYRLKL